MGDNVKGIDTLKVKEGGFALTDYNKFQWNFCPFFLCWIITYKLVADKRLISVLLEIETVNFTF